MTINPYALGALFGGGIGIGLLIWGFLSHQEPRPASATSAPEPDLRRVTPFIMHDDSRGVTCYELPTGASCIPDWQLKAPGHE